jgi:hypothetical protein
MICCNSLVCLFTYIYIYIYLFIYIYSDTELDSVLHDIAEAESISWETQALVIIGRDTRYSFCIYFSVK